MLNGRPLPSGTKFIPTYEFGIVKLVINDALLRDAGMFKCTATNNKGMASTSGTLHILTEADGGVSTKALHPSGKAGLDAIEKVELSASGKLPSSVEEESVYQAPRFTTDLPAEIQLNPEEELKLECSVEPKNDSYLKINWYHNGLPLATGTRIRASSDFGYVHLAIGGITERDAGVYTCKAVNKIGNATTFTKVNVKAVQGGIDLSTKHPRGSEGLDSIASIEAKGLLPDDDDTPEKISPPVFTKSFEDCEIDVDTVGHFEAQLEPRNENMNLEWHFNGKPLKESKKYLVIDK